MITFSMYARNIQELKLNHNIYHKIKSVQTAIKKDRIIWVGTKNLYYLDTNINEHSIDGELIRSGRYKQYEFGKLAIQLNSLIILAKISPFGDRNLNSGYITDTGQFIIDLNEHKIKKANQECI